MTLQRNIKWRWRAGERVTSDFGGKSSFHFDFIFNFTQDDFIHLKIIQEFILQPAAENTST